MVAATACPVPPRSRRSDAPRSHAAAAPTPALAPGGNVADVKLIVTAVAAERDAVLSGLAEGVAEVHAVGVGPVKAAAATARILARAEGRFDAVLNVGVAGGLAGRVASGDVVVGTVSVAAELGVRHESGFTPLGELGFGSNRVDCDPRLTERVPGARGEILTLATITGAKTLADSLADEYPLALAEAMEGFGVAEAAHAVGLPFAEVRTISNAVGDRDVAGWDWQGGFAALTRAMEHLV